MVIVSLVAYTHTLALKPGKLLILHHRVLSRENEKNSYYTVKLLFGVYYGAWLSGEWRGREIRSAHSHSFYTHTRFEKKDRLRKNPRGTSRRRPNGEITQKTDELSDLTILEN